MHRHGVESRELQQAESDNAPTNKTLEVSARQRPTQSSGGCVFVSVEYPKLCGAEFADSGGPCVSVPVFVSGTIAELLNSAAVIDTRQLLLRPAESDTSASAKGADSAGTRTVACQEEARMSEMLGQAFAWHLYVHVLCLEYDGNPLDFALLASVAALENTRLPAVVWDKTAKWWRHSCEQRSSADGPAPDNGGRGLFFPGRQVFLKNRPTSVTFAQIMGQWWVVDPSREEENLGCSVSLCMVKDRWHILRLGGVPVGTSVLKDLQSRAEVIAKGLDCQLKDSS